MQSLESLKKVDMVRSQIIQFCRPREELDLKDLKETEKWFKKFKPTVVIVAAAKVGGIMPTQKIQQILY